MTDLIAEETRKAGRKMRMAWKCISVLVTIIFLIAALPVAVLQADSSFKIRLDQSIENAVFTLTYQGLVQDLSLTSPSGYELQSTSFPEAFIYEDGLIRVGVRTAGKGRWGICITGEPEDGFQIVVTSDSRFSGRFWESPDPSDSEESKESPTEPITETETSITETTLTEPQTPQNSDIQQTEETKSATEAATESTVETSAVQIVLPIESTAGKINPSVRNSPEATVNHKSNKDAGFAASAEEPLLTEPDPPLKAGPVASADQRRDGQKDRELSSVDDRRSQDPAVGTIASVLSEKTGSATGNDARFVEKGLAVYVGVFLPVLLSIGVFVMELRVRKRSPVMLSHHRKKSRPSLLKRPPSREEGLHDEPLWRTSTWQAPSQPR